VLAPFRTIGSDHLDDVDTVEDGFLDGVSLGKGPLDAGHARQEAVVVFFHYQREQHHALGRAYFKFGASWNPRERRGRKGFS
jgi:hypothetical protein